MIACAIVTTSAHAITKIDASPRTFTVTEGNKRDVNFSLEAPIIGGPDVTVNFTVDDPSRIMLSSSSVNWTAAQWFQVRTITVTAIHDNVQDASTDVVVHGTASSRSLFYDGATMSFAATITDIDAAPTTTTTAPPPTTMTVAPETTTTSSAQPSVTTVAPLTGELPRTGSASSGELVFAVSCVAAGLALIIARRRLYAAAGTAKRS